MGLIAECLVRGNWTWVCTCRRSLHLVNGTQPRYRLLVSVTSCCNTRVSGGYPPVGWVTNIGVTKGCSPESTGTTSFNLSNTSLQLRCQKHACLHWKETQPLRLTSLGQGATGEGSRRTPIMGHPRIPDTFLICCSILQHSVENRRWDQGHQSSGNLTLSGDLLERVSYGPLPCAKLGKSHICTLI